MTMMFNPSAHKLLPGVQPQYPVEIDWSHPLTKGLVFAQVGGRNYVDNTVGVSTGGTQTPFGVDKGRRTCLSTSSVPGTAVRFSAPSLSRSNILDITIFKQECMSSAPAWCNSYVLEYGSGFNDFGFGRHSTNDAIAFWRSGADIIPSGIPFFSTAFRTLAISWADAENPKFYLDGALASTPSAGGPASLQFDPNVWVNGAGTVGSLSPTGATSLSYIFNRALSASEIASLNLDTYQIFRPAIPMPVFTAAGVSYATSKSWNGSAWVTGALKQWNGSSYDTHNIPKTAVKKTWNGSAWV